MKNITIARLQEYIKEQDYNPELKQGYFLKLAEEVGELSRAMRKNASPAAVETFKGSIEEEIYDVIYYALAIANCYDIDVEKWIYVKEKINDEKYGRNHAEALFVPE
ncbi:MAG: hypothetical protein FWG72_06375 [Oscillospiraceae bacterium]|nr:hypothetical protein [Oscillospiraceae bacterium]